MELCFVGRSGKGISFVQTAKALPKSQSSIGKYNLPTNMERRTVGDMDRFYDLFQVIYPDKEGVASNSRPSVVG